MCGEISIEIKFTMDLVQKLVRNQPDIYILRCQIDPTVNLLNLFYK